jgi:hypothetical protein
MKTWIVVLLVCTESKICNLRKKKNGIIHKQYWIIGFRMKMSD